MHNTASNFQIVTETETRWSFRLLEIFWR
jgi:hypothetical protein